MPRRETKFEQGEFYHIFNRGVNKNRIFFKRENYLFLLSRIKKYSKKLNILVPAYCLMPNHYHMLLYQSTEHSISEFVQLIFNSYTKAINNRYGRSGTLFEGRFKSILVKDRDYLIHLCSYIHRNPIEAGISSNFGNWPYSNLPEWLDLRKGQLFSSEFRNTYFDSSEEYLTFLKSYDMPEECKKLFLDT